MTMEEPSWRDKCIETFSLKPVPASWKDHEVAHGSEKAWERCYEFRKEQEEIRCEQKVDEEYEVVLEHWSDKLEALVTETLTEEGSWKWSTLSKISSLAWEDTEVVRTGTLHSFVWSPYAIPHAIFLENRYHARARMSSFEFFCAWNYMMLDFENYELLDFENKDTSNRNDPMTMLCSNCFEDEVLRADVIDTSHLTKSTLEVLRRFVFGSCRENAKQETMDDFTFVTLLFGAMGTFDYGNLYMKEDIGYAWRPMAYLSHHKEVVQQMVKDKVIRDETETWSIPATSWLEYRIRQI